MKKVFYIILFFIYTFSLNSAEPLRWNKIYEGGSKFKINRVDFSLPNNGQWTLLSIDEWTIKGISFRGATFVKTKDNTLSEIFGAGAVNSHGQFISVVDGWLYENVFGRDNYDGCLEKKEYYLVVKKTQSASFNCFIVRHDDVQKSIFYPDGKPGKQGIIKTFNDSWVRKWVRDKKILLPKIMLTSDHYFYDKRTGFHAAIESHSINPEHNGGPKTLYGDEEKSEYHKYNIAKHNETKSYMDKFIIDLSLKHTNFEARVGSRDDFKLDLSQYTINKEEFKKVNKQNSSNVVSQLKELRDLLEENIITKDEFEIAKKKLLN